MSGTIEIGFSVIQLKPETVSHNQPRSGFILSDRLSDLS